MCFRRLLCVRIEIDQLHCNNSLRGYIYPTGNLQTVSNANRSAAEDSLVIVHAILAAFYGQQAAKKYY